MKKFESAWAIRPFPHGKYRMQEFIDHGIAAIGWPALGDLRGRNRDVIKSLLKSAYYENSSEQALGQATGIVDRFVNQIAVGDAVLIPDAGAVYFGRVTTPYEFQESLSNDGEGYPHWIKVEYLFDGQPIDRSELPALLFDSLKGRLTVFNVPVEPVNDVASNPTDYRFLERLCDVETKAEYVTRLSEGRQPGINSNQFESAARNLLGIYFNGLRRLPTSNAPIGADTDLKADLPGNVVVRIQVKCFQENRGPLNPTYVDQLRNSMEPGEHGILVTTGTISEDARSAAAVDPERPIGFIDGSEFAELVFDNLDQLSDRDLWCLGLRRSITIRR